MACHGCAKAALFGLCGVLLDQYGSVDERGLHGKARALRAVGLLFALGALVLAGLPPFGAGLGKALGEEAAGTVLLPVLLLTSAVTGGTLLRAAARIFRARDGPRAPRPRMPRPAGRGRNRRSGSRGRHRTRPWSVLAVLLFLGLLVGTVPAVAESLGHGAALFTDRAGGPAAAAGGAGTPGVGAAAESLPTEWTAAGAVLGLASAALACLLAGAALWVAWGGAGVRGVAAAAVLPLRRLHSGLVGDYLAGLAVGVAALLLAVALQA